MIWKLTEDTQAWIKLYEMAPYYAHTLSVRRIRFNLRFSDAESSKFTVATCASDQTVRMFSITL